MSQIDQKVLERARVWTSEEFDSETREKVRDMIENDPQEVVESFYRDLEFGTGGLRGIMGAGTNRMNKYTVGMATQGLTNYLKKMFPDTNLIKVAIAHDSRNNSSYFARITAEVFSANGIKVYLFDGMRPTPELSFTIRHLNCQSGIVITASHNPKEYNGYKAYWNDGGQLVPPHDKNVIREVQKITSVSDVHFEGNPQLIEMIGKDIDDEYLEQVSKLSLADKTIATEKDLKVVYTPLHGTGAKLVPASLKAFGFNNVELVEAQAIPDGNFPTVHSPNPEEPAALEMALNQARKIDADLVMATDPDADRVGIAVKDHEGNFILLNGNQAASLLIYYILTRWHEKGLLTDREMIVKTIVTTELLCDIAGKFKVHCPDVLTGFKWIAELIREKEGELKYIAGGEESYGFMIGDFVRDKDAVSACSLIAETAAWAKSQGKSLFDLMLDIYMEFGFYKEKLISIVKKGKSGSEEIQQMMAGYRSNPPATINNSKVIRIKDYQSSEDKDIRHGTTSEIKIPKSNVLQFFTEDGSKISVRPSGTEPKIKFYFGVKTQLEDKSQYDEKNKILEEKVNAIIKDMGLQD